MHLYVCMLYVCMYVFMHIYVCIFTYTIVYIYICIFDIMIENSMTSVLTFWREEEAGGLRISRSEVFGLWSLCNARVHIIK